MANLYMPITWHTGGQDSSWVPLCIVLMTESKSNGASIMSLGLWLFFLGLLLGLQVNQVLGCRPVFSKQFCTLFIAPGALHSPIWISYLSQRYSCMWMNAKLLLLKGVTNKDILFGHLGDIYPVFCILKVTGIHAVYVSKVPQSKVSIVYLHCLWYLLYIDVLCNAGQPKWRSLQLSVKFWVSFSSTTSLTVWHLWGKFG